MGAVPMRIGAGRGIWDSGPVGWRRFLAWACFWHPFGMGSLIPWPVNPPVDRYYYGFQGGINPGPPQTPAARRHRPFVKEERPVERGGVCL